MKYPVVTGSTTKQKQLGTYSYGMLEGMLDSKSGTMAIPTGFHVEYKMQAELSTAGGTNVKLFLNNIETNWIQTYSAATFRQTAATDYFKKEDITLETTLGYANPGINFGWVANNASSAIRVYLPTLSAYLVRDTAAKRWTRTA